MVAKEQKPLTLRRNFSWAFVGNVVYAACQWGMLVVLAKFGTPEMLGQFTLGLAVTSPVLMFTNLQLRVVQATDTKQRYFFGDYLGLRLIGIGLALPVIVGITIAAGYRWETSLVILALGLARAFESISDVFYGLIQQHERMDRIGISLMIGGPLSLLLFSIGVYLTKSTLGGAVGLAVAFALVLVCYDIPSGALFLRTPPWVDGERGRGGEGENFPSPNPQSPTSIQNLKSSSAIQNQLRPRWHLKMLGQLVWLTLPLGLVMMLNSLNTNIPRYLIERYLGERELGIFAAIAYLMVAGTMVVNALGHSASSRLAKYYVTGNSAAFRRLLLKLVGVGALLGGAAVLVALVAGQDLLLLLYGPEYAQRADLFVWLMIVAGIGYASFFLTTGMTAARYFSIQIPLFALVTGTSATACLWLIPISGLRGVVIALMIGAIVQAAFSWGVILHAIHRLDKHTESDY